MNKGELLPLFLLFKPMQAQKIEILGALTPQKAIAVETILKVLQSEETPLQHGEEFTGRPSTKIFTDGQNVVKFRTEFNFPLKEARRWIGLTIEQERSYGIHHPAKTWFLIHGAEDSVTIANITPQMQPLHQAHDQLTADQFADHLVQLLEWYFRLAHEQEKRLDEGLSNFAFDAEGTLYYLDDDIYHWDDFTSLCLAVGIYLLRLDHLELHHWQRLGETIGRLVLQNLKDPHWVAVITDQLRGLFIANDRQLECREHLFRGMRDVEIGSDEKSGEEVRTVKIYTQALQPQALPKGDVIALLGDIHGNYPALQAVLDELSKLGVSEGIVLGDVVGYGPHPKECIEALRETKLVVIKGNHDHGVASGSTSQGFSTTARWVVDWSRERLASEALHWLEALPPYIQEENWLALHGAPVDKTFFNGYVYRMTYEDNLSALQRREIPICFHGHTHISTVYARRKGKDFLSKEDLFSLEDIEHSLVCPGSVGKTRSGRPAAEFALYKPKSKEIRFYRLEYDLDKTLGDMRHFSFPPQLIERLRSGE